jgi:hypothetical protein
MRGKQVEKSKWFIVMNSHLEYFAGLMYGGQIVWSPDHRDAKALDNERKFTALQNMHHGEELLLDYIK